MVTFFILTKEDFSLVISKKIEISKWCTATLVVLSKETIHQDFAVQIANSK